MPVSFPNIINEDFPEAAVNGLKALHCDLIKNRSGGGEDGREGAEGKEEIGRTREKTFPK